ncbi:aminopeptidase P family protein [Schauerella aestuarii]|uniref:aminopeptidase P family protein n=1 Tax=Schauerella aestuarii TaxID=2511204 RepID=UPI001369AC92|nr:aminopeptidase P family protein [Achromobacter aestuarii]MYZ45875.1 aminopeptidase P family protein [Achromobacter aestuarii]
MPATTQTPDTPKQRVARLRAAMREAGVDAVVVPTSDPHLSEYVPPRWQGREWLSGFKGSAGTVVVTDTFAGLWADSRYWSQAEAELAGSGIVLMRLGEDDILPHPKWLAEHFASLGAATGARRVAVDAHVLSLNAERALTLALGATNVVTVPPADGGAGALADQSIDAMATDAVAAIVLDTAHDFFDAIWPGRAGLPAQPVYAHAAPYAGEPRAAKLAHIRAGMAKHKADVHLISTLDDLAWAFNLRGSDVDYNPVFLGHALIGRDTVTLFVAAGTIDAALRAELASDGIVVDDYFALPQALAALPAGATLLIDPARVTVGGVADVPAAVHRVEAINPSTLLKSRKTDDDLAHVRATMANDGAALCEFFAWFDANQGKTPMTELTVDERLTAARARRPGFVGLSFPTIAGFNANGAMPHYRATPEAHSAIEGDGLLLIDSGGQYVGGTTDITRVVAVGTPTAAQKQDFTRVLKGMIALSQAIFPRGTPAPALDALARAPIWAGGAEYGHGTGHGVGYFLNVHEGPQVISYRSPGNPNMAMEPGMITSNEPGIYRDGQWGVRIENLVANRPWQETALGEFLNFETLTLCPIDVRCIDLSLMRPDEIAWLDAYHDKVREAIVPLVEPEVAAWLTSRTQPLAG